MTNYNIHILVCGGTGCRASQSEQIIESLHEAVSRYGLLRHVRIVGTGRLGLCGQGCMLTSDAVRLF